MKRYTKKSNVQRDFTYAREMMRQATAEMKKTEMNFNDLEQIANEMVAACSTLLEFVREEKEELGIYN